MNPEILKIVEQTPIADTHEHLVNESTRLNDPKQQRGLGALLGNYIEADLMVAGMPEEDWKAASEIQDDPDKFWRAVSPWIDRVRNTGYWQAIRESVRVLCDEDDLREENYLKIDAVLRSLVKPGFYHEILKDVCNIDHCQVNSLDNTLFRATDPSDLLLPDIGTVHVTSGFDVGQVEKYLGHKPQSLDECLELIEGTFNAHGDQVVAVKNQAAYQRKIDYEVFTKEEAAAAFKKCQDQNWVVAVSDRKPMEDFLFQHSLELAVEKGLPVKLHTGYYAGQGGMPLHRVRHNGGDMCRLCMLYPDVQFVFMHITWPYQDEAIAVAKHFPNATIDMCWAWTVNPLAAKRFLKEFLMAAPASKLLTFGGDVSYIELVPGNLQIARRGIAQAVSELVEEGWLPSQDVPALLERIMRGNALELFPVERVRG